MDPDYLPIYPSWDTPLLPPLTRGPRHRAYTHKILRDYAYTLKIRTPPPTPGGGSTRNNILILKL